MSGIFGGRSGAERAQSRIARAPFESELSQRFLPPSLRLENTGQFLNQGIQGIGDLIRRPGGLSPTVSEAIAPRLAIESENIATNFRGIGQNQAGAAARGNVPLSIRTALQSALDVAQERAQRGARRTALSDSDQLRRSDLQQVFPILDAILQFQSSGKGQAIQGLGQVAASANQRGAGLQAAVGSGIQSFAFGGGG